MSVHLPVCASVVLLALNTSALAETTRAEAIAQLQLLIDYVGEARRGVRLISKVSVRIDNSCRLETQFTVSEDGSDPATILASGNLTDVNPELVSVEFLGQPQHGTLNIHMFEDRGAWEISTSLNAAHPALEPMKSKIESGEISMSCQAEICQIKASQLRLQIPVLTGVSEKDEPKIVSLVQTLIAECKAG